MARKRRTSEQIIHKPREAEGELSKGQRLKLVCKKLGVTEQTYYRWRKEYGELRRDQAKRLREIAKENARLRRLVGEPHACRARLAPGGPEGARETA